MKRELVYVRFIFVIPQQLLFLKEEEGGRKLGRKVDYINPSDRI